MLLKIRLKECFPSLLRPHYSARPTRFGSRGPRTPQISHRREKTEKAWGKRHTGTRQGNVGWKRVYKYLSSSYHWLKFNEMKNNPLIPRHHFKGCGQILKGANLTRIRNRLHYMGPAQPCNFFFKIAK